MRWQAVSNAAVNLASSGIGTSISGVAAEAMASYYRSLKARRVPGAVSRGFGDAESCCRVVLPGLIDRKYSTDLGP